MLNPFRCAARASRTVLLLSALAGTPCLSQDAPAPARDSIAIVTVVVLRDATPIMGAVVRAGAMQTSTDERGIARLLLAPGPHWVVAAKIGFRPDSVNVTIPSADTALVIALFAQPVELSGVMVSATRSGKRIEDEPLRVEVLGPEEVEEKLLMTPGDITMMLNESSGLRVQITSPSLGGAAVRVQGLRGRYTQILADGLPLYGGQAGGLGLLQIPPMDLGGVEIIKGVASALYGGSALGGVINLISRRPEDDPAHEILLNQTTLRGTDVVGFSSARIGEGWGYTLLAGGHRQSPIDRDDDGWTDMAGYRRAVVRPRAFWSGESGSSLMLTAGTTIERREGGTLPGALAPDARPFPERLRTRRYDAGLVGGFSLGRRAILSLRGAIATQRHEHTFGRVHERDEHATWLGEASFTLPHHQSLWVVGAAIQRESYAAEDVTGFDYTFTTPGMFVQNTLALSEAVSVTASARVDRHSEYGTQLSPRMSALVHVGRGWTVRVSGGGGYSAPTPFTEETEVIGLTPLQPLDGVDAERARSASVDVGTTMGPVELNATVFGSVVDQPVALRRFGGAAHRVEVVNLPTPTRTTGAELLIRWKPERFHITGSYTFVRSTDLDPETGTRRDAPLTPTHQAGIVTMWEREGKARAGVEVYYTGTQTLEHNPYRLKSKPYVHVGVLAERRIGAARVFLNAENLLGFRQTKHDSLLRPTPGIGGRWTTDVWGPVEGRVANAGVRVDLR